MQFGVPASRLPLIVGLLTIGGVFTVRLTHRAAPPPVERVLQSNGWADERSCIDCHDEAAEFALTGHARTLHRASDPQLRELLLQLNSHPAAQSESIGIEGTPDGLAAVHHGEGVERRVTLDWCFGSGTHARTWGGVRNDSWGISDLLEFRWTWYSHLDEFDITPGQSQEIEPGFFGGLGLLFDHPKAIRCFACHATRLEVDGGHLVTDNLMPGVTCQRCHGPRGRHVETDGEFSDFTWQGIDQHESVHRCAECHRRAEEQKPEDVRPDNPDIVRFQPVGLTQSPCFLGSPEMTCLTCHDPHLPLSAQDSRGDWQCVQCHDGAQPTHALCGRGRTEDCIRCHMPKVQGQIPIGFTDHWIRVRGDAGGAQ